MTETIRVYDLAKELGKTNKEVIEKLDSLLGVKVKSHSSVISSIQANKLKQLLSEPKAETSKKPKAFIVKKAKVKEEPPEEKTEPAEEAKPQEKVKLGKIEQPVVQPLPRVKLGKVEFPKPAKTAQKPQPKKEKQDTEDKEQPKDKKSQEKKESQRAEKKPIQRHVIPQEIYEAKGNSKKKGSKKREKSYNSKEEEQERISLEKANAQKHKKRTHAEEAVEEVKSVVINQPLTVGELSEKIHKASAEIVKFLMMHGILATVNQVIDVATAKKVSENF